MVSMQLKVKSRFIIGVMASFFVIALPTCDSSKKSVNTIPVLKFTAVSVKAVLAYALEQEPSFIRDKEARGVAITDITTDGSITINSKARGAFSISARSFRYALNRYTHEAHSYV